MSRDPSLHASSLNTSETPSPKDAQVVGGHEPTPWELTPQGYISPNRENPLALLKLKSPWVEAAWDDDKEASANAALIVKAVNSHEANEAKIAAAVKALEACSAILAGYARKGLISETDSFRIVETGQSITVAQALDEADTTLSSLKEGK